MRFNRPYKERISGCCSVQLLRQMSFAHSSDFNFRASDRTSFFTPSTVRSASRRAIRFSLNTPALSSISAEFAKCSFAMS